MILHAGMAKRSVTRTAEIPPLEMRASFTHGSVDVERMTVEMTWTTGARVRRGGFWSEPYDEELSLDPKHVRMGRLQSGAAPLLDTHSAYGTKSVIGVVESASLEAKRGTAVVRFDRGEEGADVFRKVADGILRNVSVGYRVHKMLKVDDGDEEKKKPKVYRAVDWEPYEISLVPIGADADSMTRAAREQGAGAMNPCELIEERTMDDDTETTGTGTNRGDAPSAVATRAANDAEAAIAAANKSLRAAREEEATRRAAEQQRAVEHALDEMRARHAAIRRIGRHPKLGEAWSSKLIEADATEEQAQRAALEILAGDDDASGPHDPFIRVAAGDDERDKFIRGASAWLIERTGKRKLLEQAKQKDPDLFTGLEFGGGAAFRGLSPMELARDTLERQNVKTRGMDKMRMLGMAFTYRSSSYQTTSDFAVIMENVLHKILLGRYATQEMTWQRFCGTDDVPDFRPSNRYRTGSLPSLPTIAEHGEYKNGAIPDGAKYTISTERHGEIFSLSREAIINDDMGALANLAGEFGIAAARTIENDVYALLALNGGLGPTMSDSQPFFHANRANVGTGAAIAVTSLDADRVLMRAQKDPSGRDFLSLSPRVLVVPDALEGTARVINDAQYDPDTANKLQRPNMVRGLFSDIVGTPRLAANSTRRYMFADPAIATAIVVAFLEGYGRGPIMESQQGWRIDGVEWRITQYAKAQVADPKAAVTNAGA